MKEYDTILQVCAIVFAIFIVYLFFKYVMYLVKKNRLADFSLKVKNNRNNPILRIVKKTSSIIKSLSFIDGKKYSGYAKLVPGFEDGYDIVSSKLLCSLFLTFLYLFVSMLYKNEIHLVVVLICLILGYVLLDFYFIYSSRNNTQLVSKDMLGAVIIMNNDFKANRSVEQAINDVIDRKHGPIRREFKKVLDDTKLGLNYGEAFLRMYKRTGIDCVLDISHAFSLYTMIGSDLIEIFDSIEEKMVEEEKFEIQVKSIKVFNNFFRGLFYILPILVVVLTFILNDNYAKLFLGARGIVLIIILVILFITYVITINKIVRRYSYDN